MNMFNLNDEIAFVTGAGRGIGQASAIGLAQSGADVALFDLGSSNGLEDTAKSIADKGRRSVKVTGDVSDADALASGRERHAEADARRRSHSQSIAPASPTLGHRRRCRSISGGRRSTSI